VLKYDSQNKEAVMNICLRCFEMKVMYHGRDCLECRTKYLKVKRQEKERKTCPICQTQHNSFACEECSDRCKILNRHKKVNGCWEWQGKLNNCGYGCLAKIIDGNKIEIRAHRLSFEIFKGEIPEGMLVCHTCDNPSCCNPDHLWLGTPQDNTQDMLKKNRGRHRLLTSNRRANAAGKLTESQVIEMRELYKNGWSQREIREKFKISQSQVSGILTYKFWKHV